MKVPFACDLCDNTEQHDIHPLIRYCSKCDGTMGIDYQDNYEKVSEDVICNTCIHDTVGDGKMCNYCNHI